LGACSLQTAATAPTSLTHPSTWVAILGQPGWSQKYSLSSSSCPSGVVRPVLIVTCGMKNPPNSIFTLSLGYRALAQVTFVLGTSDAGRGRKAHVTLLVLSGVFLQWRRYPTISTLPMIAATNHAVAIAIEPTMAAVDLICSILRTSAASASSRHSVRTRAGVIL
jgi:hypothetical protein